MLEVARRVVSSSLRSLPIKSPPCRKGPSGTSRAKFCSRLECRRAWRSATAALPYGGARKLAIPSTKGRHRQDHRRHQPLAAGLAERGFERCSSTPMPRETSAPAPIKGERSLYHNAVQGPRWKTWPVPVRSHLDVVTASMPPWPVAEIWLRDRMRIADLHPGQRLGPLPPLPVHRARAADHRWSLPQPKRADLRRRVLIPVSCISCRWSGPTEC